MSTPITSTITTKRVIIVVQAGWVLCGLQTDEDKTDGVRLTNASVIRTWGTTRGLGQLAVEGKTSDTVLDPCGNAFIPSHAVIMHIPVHDCSDLL